MLWRSFAWRVAVYTVRLSAAVTSAPAGRGARDARAAPQGQV